jgi:hypothetical protein
MGSAPAHVAIQARSIRGSFRALRNEAHTLGERNELEIG